MKLKTALLHLLFVEQLFPVVAFSRTATTSVQRGRPPFGTRSRLRSRTVQLCAKDESDEDPTKVWYAGIADAVQNVLTNSPLNEGKKALVRSLAGDYDKEAAREKLKMGIESEPVFMLSFTKWPFCVKAKAILDSKGASYKVIELDIAEDGPGLRAEMAELIGRTSVPAIWIKKVFIGGCNDGPLGGIVSLDESGELENMLKGAGAI